MLNKAETFETSDFQKKIEYGDSLCCRKKFIMKVSHTVLKDISPAFRMCVSIVSERVYRRDYRDVRGNSRPVSADVGIDQRGARCRLVTGRRLRLTAVGGKICNFLLELIGAPPEYIGCFSLSWV